MDTVWTTMILRYTSLMNYSHGNQKDIRQSGASFLLINLLECTASGFTAVDASFSLVS
ncbi:MAG: hypothetical protein ACJAS1_002088 [Oleiphilaceae bacterium]|jgi:hypothetical protein